MAVQENELRLNKKIRYPSGHQWSGCDTRQREVLSVYPRLEEPVTGKFPLIEKELEILGVTIPNDWRVRDVTANILAVTAEQVAEEVQKLGVGVQIEGRPSKVLYTEDEGYFKHSVDFEVEHHGLGFHGRQNLPDESIEEDRFGLPDYIAADLRDRGGHGIMLGESSFHNGKLLTQRGKKLVAGLAERIKAGTTFKVGQ